MGIYPIPKPKKMKKENPAITTGLEQYEASLIKEANRYRIAFFWSIVIGFILLISLLCCVSEYRELKEKRDHLQNAYESLKSNLLIKEI